MRLHEPLFGAAEHDEARAVYARQRLEQEIVDDAVHRAGHADA